MDDRQPRVLVADDQEDVVEALRLLLKGEGFDVRSVTSPATVLDAIQVDDFDVLLLDLNYTRDTTSGQEGLALLGEIARLDGELPVVVMTAWSSIEGAVDAMRLGARDYVEKPWDNSRLLATLRSQIDLGRSLRHNRRLAGENLRLQTDGVEWIHASPAMREVREIAARVAPSDANILVTGEHGTGKEVLARWIHRHSERCRSPLITMNAGAVSDGVFESELFGHTKGAFTDAKADRVGVFELADRGTLFLDEIANMSALQQPKLLRVLETGEFQRVGSSKIMRADVRVLSATNADLESEVEAGRFRADLLYRLNTVEIRLPPLRERREDIEPLAAHFLETSASRYRKEIRGVAPDAIDALLEHPWPGNVRELRHTIERAVLLARGSAISARDLSLRTAAPVAAPESLTIENAERLMIQRALERFDGNVSRAAAHLGLSRSALYRRMSKYAI